MICEEGIKLDINNSYHFFSAGSSTLESNNIITQTLYFSTRKPEFNIPTLEEHLDKLSTLFLRSGYEIKNPFSIQGNYFQAGVSSGLTPNEQGCDIRNIVLYPAKQLAIRALQEGVLYPPFSTRVSYNELSRFGITPQDWENGLKYIQLTQN